MSRRLFTSESVTEGHPDKIADAISDSILDALLAQDPKSRVAVETLITTGQVHIAGEVTTEAYADIPTIVRKKILEIGYDSSKKGFDGESCGVSVSIGSQSADIAQGVDAAYEARVEGDADPLDAQGAGDQGLMFGYACDDTPQLMPLPIMLAHGGQIKDAEGKWIGSGPAIEQTLAYYERAWRADAVVPTEILTTAKPWTAMREKIGTGELALLFEGGWVYGGYAAKAAEGALDLENIAYLLHPTVDAGPSFTIGGPGTVWYINEASENKELAWEFIKAFNTAEIVAALNLEDPHPVARADAAALPEFQENQYLVDATASLEQAVFLPPDPNLAKVIAVIQDATGSVAAGDATPEDAAARYREDLIRAVGEENVASG